MAIRESTSLAESQAPNSLAADAERATGVPPNWGVEPRLAELDRLIYWGEEAVDVAAARRMLQAPEPEPPPVWTVPWDFGPQQRDLGPAIAEWCSIARLRLEREWPRVIRIATYPWMAYAFIWTQRQRPASEEETARVLARAAGDAVKLGLPRPVFGLSRPVNEWTDLRRSITRATVASRLALLWKQPWVGHDGHESYMAGDRGVVRSSAALLAALARRDPAATAAEAALVADSYWRVHITPIATLRSQLVRLLLACSDVARDAGVTDHQVNRWLDHRVRRYWQRYTLELLAHDTVESLRELAAIIVDAADDKIPRVVASVRSLLSGTWTENLSAQQLAREAGVSAPQLSRLFNRHVGCSIPEYRNRLRMQHAAEALAQSDKSVTAIAYACGFNNLTHFQRVFHRQFGLSPAAYRRRERVGTNRQ